MAQELSKSSKEDALKMLRRDMGDVTVGTYIYFSRNLLSAVFPSNAEAAAFVESYGCKLIFDDPRFNENLAVIVRPLPPQ